MTLSRDAHKKLFGASSTAIQEAMSRLRKQFEHGVWLSSDNPYRTDAVEGIRKAQEGQRDDQLVEYIAVSSILHCFDGWSFIGRAFDADMAGSPDIAKHLGYYAELRAAMSVLASQGVGVFVGRHVAVDKDGRIAVVRHEGGTHGFVWPALEQWTNQRGASVLFDIIEPAGVPLSTWFTEFASGRGNQRAVAVGLMKRWGLDLKLLSADHDARNAASYRPNALAAAVPRRITDVVRSLSDFWSLCEPGTAGRLRVFDDHLLGQSLEWLFTSLHPDGRSTHEDLVEFADRPEGMFDGLGLSESSRAFMRECLVTKQGSSNLLIDAQENAEPTAADYSRRVLARAAVLLRLATGCAKRVMQAADGNRRKLFEFWWRSRGVNRRLWLSDSRPLDCAELWPEAANAVEELEAWLADPTTKKSRLEFWRRWPAEAAVLTTTERICLWGLGL